MIWYAAWISRGEREVNILAPIAGRMYLRSMALRSHYTFSRGLLV
jgi:hypothetical protein